MATDREEESPSAESCVIRRGEGGWEGVPAVAYKTGDAATFRGVAKHVLARPAGAAFEVRYFEVEPGGYTSHERHRHVHVVVCLTGRGRVRLHGAWHDLSVGDVVRVAPGDPHQFASAAEEPFGFLCIVDQERDRPVPCDHDHAVGEIR